MRPAGDRANVAWDIETTGLAWSDEITVSGFWFPKGHATLIVNTGVHEINSEVTEQTLTEYCSAAVEIRSVESEAGLLTALRRLVFDRFDHDYNRLIAFHADAWNGGFDLPFTRTRCVRNGIEWVFSDVVFCDLYEPVKKRFNTSYTAYGATESINSLDGTTATLLDDNPNIPHLLELNTDYQSYHDAPYDPFANSKMAAVAYDQGDLLAVCQHNLADIQRTWELGELARSFIPTRDLPEKKL